MGENYKQSKNSKYCWRIHTPVFSQTFSVFSTKTFVWNEQEAKIIQEEINNLLEKEAIKAIPHNQAKFVSNFFLVKKKSGGFRPVINLRNLNQFIHTEHFTMEAITNLTTILSKDDWIMIIDISDVYLTNYISKQGIQGLCSFAVSNQTYRFLCMPFGLNDAARAFKKTMKHTVAKVRALGFEVLVYLDNWIFATQTRLLCLKQSQFLVIFFRSYVSE